MHYIGLMIWMVVLQGVGFVLGIITRPEISTWYALLHKSSLNPPGVVFAIVWPILYVLIAISGWLLWQQRDKGNVRLALWVYGTQLLMNWLWTPLFFHFHLIEVSFYWLVALTLLTLVYIVMIKKMVPWSGYLQIPYFIWLVFASYLNAMIWILN